MGKTSPQVVRWLAWLLLLFQRRHGVESLQPAPVQITQENKDVRAKLNYRVNDGLPHWQFARDLEPEEEAEGGQSVQEEVLIRNGRGKEWRLEERGFELVEDTTKLTTEDFYDASLVQEVYYQEMVELLKKTTGCAHAHVFSHSVRNGDRAGEAKHGGVVQSYGKSAHIDVAPVAAAEIFAGMISRTSYDGDLTKGRCLLVNAWRNINHDDVVRSTPLAVCDATSVVAPDDFVTFNLETNQYRVVQYRLANAHVHNHNWIYFPEMSSNEILIFKQWDSDFSRSVRSTFHSAFDLPPEMETMDTRQSIEVRALCFFPDHLPNTCPDVDAIWGH